MTRQRTPGNLNASNAIKTLQSDMPPKAEKVIETSVGAGSDTVSRQVASSGSKRGANTTKPTETNSIDNKSMKQLDLINRV